MHLDLNPFFFWYGQILINIYLFTNTITDFSVHESGRYMNLSQDFDL